jgi:DNA-directed RNA polymerase subunit H (RpoH/RPB5)
MDTFNNMRKVITNTLKMLKERGYNTKPYEEYLTDEKMVGLYHKENFELIIEPLKKNMKLIDTIHVRFSVHCKPSYDYIKSLVNDLIQTDSDTEKDTDGNDNSDESSEEEEIPEILLIFSLPVKGDRFFNNKVQMLEYGDLLFNKIDHVFVPKHELIQSPLKISELIDYYKVSNKWRFPIMYKTDPISKYYNAKKGDIFKITRDSIHGESIVYRCVL